MIGRGSIIWLIVSLVAAVLAGYFAYADAEKFAAIVYLLATIISILIGVSLAVIAVLTSPFSVSEEAAANGDEAARITKIVKQDDETLASGQLMFFWIYYGALALSLVFSWTSAGDTTDFGNLCLKVLACVTAAGEPPLGGPRKLLVHDGSLVHWDECFGCWRSVAKCAVRPDCIVVSAPLLNENLSFAE